MILAEAISETEDGEFQKKIDRLVSLGELSAYVAHEIRNPLTGIRTTVQFVGSKFNARDPRREDLQDVISELDRIEQIITGLLMFARPPAPSPSRASCTRCSTRRWICSSSSSATRRSQLQETIEDLPLVARTPTSRSRCS